MSPVRYELGFYIPEDDIPHSDRWDNINSVYVRTCRSQRPHDLRDCLRLCVCVVLCVGIGLGTG
jgi:hypothetical protein